MTGPQAGGSGGSPEGGRGLEDLRQAGGRSAVEPGGSVEGAGGEPGGSVGGPPEHEPGRSVDAAGGDPAQGRPDPEPGGSVEGPPEHEPGASRSDTARDHPIEPPAAHGAGATASRWDRSTAWWGFTPPRTPRQRARARAIQRGVIAGVLLLIVGSGLRLPLLIFSPGPTYNTIGEVNGEPMIVITGTDTYPTDGNLDMTTVSERGGSSGGVHLGEALIGWMAPTGAVVPRESVYGPQTSGDEVEQRNDQLFALSQSDAIAAAMGELGIPTERHVVVTLVGGGTPADGIVQAGDIIVAVDGQAVQTPAEVSAAVRSRQVGDTVILDVLRAEEPDAERAEVRLEVVTAANPDPLEPNPDGSPVAYLGIVVGTMHTPPFEIDFTLENVSGPSSGLMFSLALVDMLTPGALTGGDHVAGTGTIDPEGAVGPIGGIRQKMLGASQAGASLFLAPDQNCDEVIGSEPDGLAVVPVGTLAEARGVVEAWADGERQGLATCRTVAAAGR